MPLAYRLKSSGRRAGCLGKSAEKCRVCALVKRSLLHPRNLHAVPGVLARHRKVALGHLSRGIAHRRGRADARVQAVGDLHRRLIRHHFGIFFRHRCPLLAVLGALLRDLSADLPRLVLLAALAAKPPAMLESAEPIDSAVEIVLAVVEPAAAAEPVAAAPPENIEETEAAVAAAAALTDAPIAMNVSAILPSLEADIVCDRSQEPRPWDGLSDAKTRLELPPADAGDALWSRE